MRAPAEVFVDNSASSVRKAKVGPRTLFEIRNPKPKSAILNPQSSILNPQSTIHNPQSAIHNPKPQSAIRNLQSAIAEIRNPQPP
ncbi:MAG TPA: hypothetical protein VGQ81_09505 [Acidobacteriota bacterium]|nr:hypothetical protein [Acidobacteriota bacterium]